MLTTVIDICKNIIELVRNNNNVELERKLRISNILMDISTVLEDTSTKLLRNEYPQSNCATMLFLSQTLHEKLDGYISPEELTKLHDALQEASLVEKQYALRHDPQTIPTIQNASGEFRAMSILLRI
mgnify:CR=1 FL=1